MEKIKIEQQGKGKNGKGENGKNEKIKWKIC